MTKIEWTDESWNPVTGCSHAGGPGCDNCWAKRMANRLRGRFGYPQDDPFKVTLHPDRLDVPLEWRKPRMVFVCSMGDLFHEDVPDDFILDVLFTVADADHHTFQLLTKRADRMKRYFSEWGDWLAAPWDNVWLGVSVENQKTADERIPALLQTPAAVCFLSLEPLLGPVNLGLPGICPKDWGRGYIDLGSLIHLLIIGCESGPHRRETELAWVYDLVQQARDAGVLIFIKQLEIDGRVEHDMTKFPPDLQIRETSAMIPSPPKV